MKKLIFTIIFASLFSIPGANAQGEPFIGEVRIFAGTFAPRGWAFCDGQLLSIAQNTALFSLLGTTYGGDGRNNFALPDLRGRVPVQQGSGPGLTFRSLGEEFGTENSTLTQANLPAHTHGLSVKAVSEAGNTNAPEGNYPANSSLFDNEYRSTGTEVNMKAQNTSTTNGAQNSAVNNLQPSITVNYIIAIEGLFPTRS